MEALQNLIPLLRFEEFREKWKTKQVKDVLKIGSGKDYKHLSTGNIPVYGTGGLMTLVDDYLYEGESVCIGRKGTINKPKFLNEKFWTVDTLFYTHSFKKVKPKFVFSLFQNINWKKYNEASGVPSLSKSTIEKIKLNIPSLTEQKKIASFLTSIDTKITLLTRKKELLEEYKKGVMKKIFKQKLRFKDDDGTEYPRWKENKLGSIIEICSSKRVLQKDWKEDGVAFYRTREIISLSKNREFRTPIFITEELYNSLAVKYGVPKKGDLLVSGVGTIGSTYVVKDSDKFYFKDGNVIWFKMNDRINSEFLYQQFKTRYLRKQLSDNASITTVATFTIKGARKTKILLPSIEEQTKIANFLSAIDTKIKYVDTQLEKTKTFKKGLLQQLFV